MYILYNLLYVIINLPLIIKYFKIEYKYLKKIFYLALIKFISVF